MSDLSDDATSLRDESEVISQKELTDDIDSKAFARQLQRWAFCTACVISCVYFGVLLLGVLCLLHRDGAITTITENWHFWLALLIVFAAIPTTLTLALIRVAFSNDKGEEKKGADMPSILMQLGKEIVGVLNTYLSKK